MDVMVADAQEGSEQVTLSLAKLEDTLKHIGQPQRRLAELRRVEAMVRENMINLQFPVTVLSAKVEHAITELPFKEKPLSEKQQQEWIQFLRDDRCASKIMQIREECVSDARIGHEVMVKQTYCPGSTQSPLFGPIFGIRATDFLADLGSNVAWVLYWAASHGVTQGVAYEPSPLTFEVCSANASRINAHFNSQFQVVREAIDATGGRMELAEMSYSRHGSSRSCAVHLVPYAHNDYIKVNVRKVALSEVLAAHPISWLKMDIEGADLACLAHEHNWQKVRVFCVEMSTVRLRRKHNFNRAGLTEFAGILKRLYNAGFCFMKSSEQVLDSNYWTNPKHPRAGYDANLWFYNPDNDERANINLTEEMIAKFHIPLADFLVEQKLL